MVLSIIILGLILWNIYLGYRQGIIYKTIHLCSYLIAGWVAFNFTHPITGLLVANQPQNNVVIINAATCLILFIISFVLVRKIGQKLNGIGKLPVLNVLNSFLGALLGLVIGYLLVYLALKLLLPTGNQWLQSQYLGSPVAQYVNETSLAFLFPNII